MNEALKEARQAYDRDEVPVGAVMVLNNRIIARGRNMTEELTDVTAHAEMICITSAANYLGAKYLPDCTLYVTIEPCGMCASATRWAQLGKIVYGASDPKAGYGVLGKQVLHPRTDVVSGVLENECGNLMTDFFAKKRAL